MKINEILVVKDFTFAAAHRLPLHEGLCSNIHGHTYKLRVGISGMVDGKTGMVVDFTALKEVVNEVLVCLDHKYLNNVYHLANFPSDSPTAERMTQWFCGCLSLRLGGDVRTAGCRLDFIRLYESPTSYAEWRRGDPL